ncbi:micronuclear linker histone poly -like, partial [Pelobates cultripes]
AEYMARRPAFTKVFRAGLGKLGLPAGRFGTHSFRIGAATEAARLGLGDEVVKRIGRWESVRFRSYIWTGDFAGGRKKVGFESLSYTLIEFVL